MRIDGRINRRRLIGAGLAAGMIAAASVGRAFAAEKTGFTHGVASGDPRADSVVLWTRFAPAQGGETALRVETALDPDFAYPLAAAGAAASAFTDFCAKVRVGGLPARTTVYYRFIAPDGSASPVGRTRTLPAPDDPRPVRIAVFSCSNATSGWFNAYAHAARRDDVDLAVHTGDYIYESRLTRSDAVTGLALERGIEPVEEIIALSDYRRRYASYRLDRDLQALHAALPMINVWDDHETANNSWVGGAEGHNEGEGGWAARRDAGVRAFYEWLPMDEEPYAAYDLGRHATLFRLETRLLARSEQLDLGKVLAGARDPVRAVDAFLKGPLVDPARTLMGPAQEAWLAAGMKSSTAAGRRWQILAQQVVMQQRGSTPVRREWFAPGEGITPEIEADMAQRALLARAGAPSSLDKWDGYPAARTRLYTAARAAGAEIVTLTGDSHNAWASDLYDGAGPVGVEFAGQSVSSFGMERRFTGDPALIAGDFIAANPGLVWCDTHQRGYFTLDVAAERVSAEWVFVPAGESRTGGRETGRHRLVVEAGARRIA